MSSEMESNAESADLRPEIALGWRRSLMSGLDQGMEVKEPRLFEVDRHSRLVRAADPVLTSMVAELDDTRFSILLADHSARIVDRRLSNRGLHRHLDRVKAIPGAQYIEEFSGTNALATAFELRKPIAVAGDEHYLEALRVFCCYGAPIIHPITRRLEGVLDVTGPVADQSNLLGPFLMRAIRDIEQRLLEGARMSEQRLFSEFQAESARGKSALVLFGEDLALSNAAATDLISSEDSAVLRALAAELGPSGRLTRTILLASGREVDVRARVADESRDGVLIEVIPHDLSMRSPVAAHRTESHTDSNREPAPHTSLVVGAPGSGRTRKAWEIAGEDAVMVDLAEATDLDSRERLRTALMSRRPVIVDNIHAADDATATFIRRNLIDALGPVVLVGALSDVKSDEHLALAAAMDETVELPRLRDYGHRFVHVVRGITQRLAADNNGGRLDGTHLRVAPSAVEVLAEQDWPQNLTELERILRLAARGRTRGDITVDDLPDTHRQRPQRSLTRLERAERATILATLDECEGNKKLAAAALGIGRNTLYQRLRYYQIST